MFHRILENFVDKTFSRYVKVKKEDILNGLNNGQLILKDIQLH